MIIMGLSKEVVGNYALSVLKRATGRDVYEQWQKYVDTVEYNNITRSMHENKRSTGLVEGAIQIAFPFWMDAASRVARAEQKTNPFMAMVRAAPALVAEFISWNYLVLPAFIHNPLEGIAVKLAVNIATPIVSDLSYKIMGGITRLRPPTAPVALAI